MKKIFYVLVQTKTRVFHTTLGKIVAIASEANITGDPIFTDSLNVLSEYNTRYNKAIAFAIDLAENKEKDDKRDVFLCALFDGIEFYLNSPISSKRMAAEKLNEALRRYSKASAYKPMLEESSDIANILSICETAEIQEAINSLGDLGDVVNALRDSENAFLESSKEYDFQKGEGQEQENASDIKPEITEYLNETFLAYLFAVANIKPEIYGDIANSILEVVKTNNRNTRRKKENIEPDVR